MSCHLLGVYLCEPQKGCSVQKKEQDNDANITGGQKG